MDIVQNQLQAPVEPVAVAPYGISKFGKSYLDALKANLDANVAKVNAQNVIVKNFVETLKADAEQAIVDAATDRAAIRSELQTASDNQAAALQGAVDTASADRQLIRDELASGLAAAQTAASDAVAVERARLDDLEAWRTNNTDEIATEVDKAINSKVSQLSFDQIKADLETADSQISQNLASAITARTEKDAEHDELLQRMEKFVNTMLSTYTLVDADGNALTSFADVVLVPPPVLLYNLADGTDVYTNTTYTVTADKKNPDGSVAGSIEYTLLFSADGLTISYEGQSYTMEKDVAQSNATDIYFKPVAPDQYPVYVRFKLTASSFNVVVNNINASSNYSIFTANTWSS